MKTPHYTLFRAGGLTLLALAACLSVARAQNTPAAKTDEVVNLEKFAVTGSNIARLEQEQVLPVSTLGREDLAIIGAPTVGEILETLPYSQNITINDSATGSNDARGDITSVNLRNLGTGRSLVLLNGRRMSAHGVTPGTPPVSFVNLSSIPAAAIERIEVLRDGASAIYGSDAVGGVLNIILKRNYTGYEVSARSSFGTPGPDEFSVDALSGFSLNDDKTNVTLTFSYYDRKGLFARDRSYSAEADKRLLVAQPFASNAKFNHRSASSPFGRFTAVDATGAGVSVPGFTLTSGSTKGRFFLNPVTGTFAAGTSLSGDTGYNFQNETQLIPDTTRYTFYSTLDHKLSERISLFGEASYYYATSTIQEATTPISANTDGVVVPKTNFYNPLGTRCVGPGTANPTGTPRVVLIRNYRPLELGPRLSAIDNGSVRLLGGFRAKVGQEWNLEGGALYMRGKVHQESRNAMSQSRLVASLARSTPDAMNVFSGPNVNSQDTLNQFRIKITDDGVGTLGLLDARLTGPLYHLPAGDIQSAWGVEYRREDMSQRNDSFGLADDIIAQSQQLDVDAQRDVYAAYGEVLVPLIPAKRGPFSSLELRVAARFEDFGKFSATKPAAGLSWQSTDWLKFRTSYNKGFRAPAISELFAPTLERRNLNLFDIARDGQEDALGTISKKVVTGGNPLLQPEESTNFNAGVVIDIKPVKGLSVSADYYHIKQDGRIDNPSTQDQLNLDNRLWDANHGSNPSVIRAPQTPEDIVLNIPGKLIEVRGTFQNLASRTVEGIDLVLLYRGPQTSLGRFSMHVEGAYTSKVEEVDVNGNVANLIRQSGNPYWKGSGSVSWKQGNWSAAMLVKYISDYEDNDSLDTPDGSGGTIPFVISSWTTFSPSVGYRFSSGRLRGLSLRVGANNVFDKNPPFTPSDNDGFDHSYHDARQRTWWAEAKYQF